MKTITVEDETWVKLTMIKVKEGKDTINSVIEGLLKVSK